MNEKNLKKLYQNTSKHSNYQILPKQLVSILNTEELVINSRFENERLAFIKENINLKQKRIVDIGGNTGFFTFESIESGASSLMYYEGNMEHATFVKSASDFLNLNISVQNVYLNFDDTDNFEIDADVVLLLNVIHHLGDDFGNKSLNINDAKSKMINSINYFSKKTKYLVLQMGYCWKGDRGQLLFEDGTKKEMIDFVKNATVDYWNILAIGVAEEKNKLTKYNLLNKDNIIRNDKLGEFRNRPLFILQSKF